MILKVSNICGCLHAEFKIEPETPALIRGLNESGKSSILLALRVLLTRNTNPLNLKATSKLRYVTRGAGEAEASLIGPDWSLKWDGMSGEIEETGPVPLSVNGMLSSHSYLLLTGKPSNEAWQSILGVQVEQEELAEALLSALHGRFPDSEKIVKELVRTVFYTGGEDGWKTALENASFRSRAAQQKWSESVAEAGEKASWGLRKGGQWHPKAWTVECEGLTETVVLETVRVASSKLEEARKVRHVTEEQLVSRAKLVVQINVAEKEYKQLEAAVVKIKDDLEEKRRLWLEDRLTAQAHSKWVLSRSKTEAELKSISAELSDLYRQEQQDPVEADLADCPHCGRPVRITMGKLDKPPSTAIQERIATLKKNWHGCEKIMEEKEPKGPEGLKEPKSLHQVKEYREGMSLRTELQLWKDELGTYPDPESSKVGQAEDLSEIEEDYNRANVRLNAVVSFFRASNAHEETVAWEAARKILGPSGLRAKALSEKTNRFNHIASSMSVKAGEAWSKVGLNEKTWQLEIDNIPITLCSRSEQWRAMVTVSMVIAYMIESPVCIIDDMDTLVGVEELGDTAFGMTEAVRSLVKASSIPVVIASARDTDEDLSGGDSDVRMVKGRQV